MRVPQPHVLQALRTLQVLQMLQALRTLQVLQVLQALRTFPRRRSDLQQTLTCQNLTHRNLINPPRA
jgi:hypothetical protein